jgi:hypothetical protein
MSYSGDMLVTELKEEFETADFHFENLTYAGVMPCFFISVKCESDLVNTWMKVSDTIAVNYQARLTDEFSIWNLYLFFLIENPVSNELKYQIENDTFSSRKIVIEGVFDLQKIIEEHILNSDIIIDSTLISESNFTPNPIIYNQLENLEVKSKVTEALKAAHLKIKNRIKNESHEI